MDQIVTGDSPLKTERLGGSLLWLTILLTGGFVSACLAEVVWHVFNQPPTPTGALIEVTWLVMAGGAALSVWLSVQRAVTVFPDHIEMTNGFTTRSFQRSEIKGYRRLPGALINLVPSDEFSKPLRVSAELLDDPLTQKWFEGLPDLDAKGAQAAQENPVADAVSEDAGWAARSPGQLLHWTWVLTGVSLALGAWIIVWPEPHALAVLAAIALMLFTIALKIYLGPLVSIASEKGHPDPRPSIQVPFMVPAFAMFMRAITDFHLMDWLPILKLAACTAITPAVLLVAHDKRLRSSIFLILVVSLLLLGFFFGALAEINEVFDNSPPVVYRTSVVGKHVTSGKSTTYYLQLAPWGDQYGGDVSVGWRYYERIGVGDVVCVFRANGLLGFRYYEVGDCR